MKKLFVSALAALLLVSCGSKKETNQSEAGAKAAVEEVYNTYFAWSEDNFNAPEGSGPETYFGPLAAYLTQDFSEAYCKASEKSYGLDDLWLDVDPWINAQDFDNLSLKDVQIQDYTGEKALAVATLHNLGQENEIRLTLVYDAASDRWLVDNLGELKEYALEYYNAPVEEEE